MELHHIRAFLAVGEELHFGRAAAKLHIAQPPLSRTIRQLERELGAALFERTTRSVRLTAAGEALLPHAREILDGVQTARLVVRSAGHGVTGRVRMGFAGPSSHTLVVRLAKAVRREHPGIDLVLRSATFMTEGLNQVVDGSIDCAIVRWDSPPPGLASRPVAREHLVVVLPQDHPLAGESTLSMSQLSAERWVTLSPEPVSYVYKRFLMACHEAGFIPDVVQQAPENWTVMGLVAAGVGITLTFDSVAANVANPAVSIVPLEHGRDVVWARLAWREEDRNPALRRILELSEDVLPTPPEAG